MEEAVRLLDPGVSSRLRIPRPETEDELREFLRVTLGVTIPDVAVCKGHSTPWRAFSEAYFGRVPVSIWKGARGLAGKSFLLALLAWTEAVTLRASVTVLGGSGEQSERVHDYLRMFWMRPGVPVEALLSEPGKRHTYMIWGNKIDAQTASQTSVRGAHPQRLRLDEIDEMDLKVLEAALGQPMTKDGVLSQTVASSTHQHADGTMTEMLRLAAIRNWSVHEWCYRETMEPHGWLSPAEIERKRATMTAESWRVEVELGEPSPEGRAILPEYVEALFRGDQVRLPDWTEWSLPPVPGAVYATGCDWAKEQHLTCIWTWRVDTRPMSLAAYVRGNKRPWPWMIERLMERVRTYPGEAFHDRLGVGGVVRDEFTEPVEDYAMVGKARNDLFLNYIAAVERGDYRAPRIATAYDSHKYVTNKDLFGTGHPPDEFVAAAMAHQAVLQARNPVGLVSSAQDQAPPQPASPAARVVSQPTGYLASVLMRQPPAATDDEPVEEQVRSAVAGVIRTLEEPTQPEEAEG